MSLVIPPGFAQAAIEFRNDGDPDPWYITMGIDLSDAGGDLDAVADNIANAWSFDFLGLMSTNTLMSAVVLTVGQDGADNIIFRKAYLVPGSSSQPKLPQNCALLISKNSALGGRKNRGRFFVPNVLAEGDVSNVGVISSGAFTDYVGYTNTFFTSLEGGTVPGVNVATPMVILHNSGPSVPVPTPVTSLSPDTTISTQRRRLR